MQPIFSPRSLVQAASLDPSSSKVSDIPIGDTPFNTATKTGRPQPPLPDRGTYNSLARRGMTSSMQAQQVQVMLLPKSPLDSYDR